MADNKENTEEKKETKWDHRFKPAIDPKKIIPFII